MCTFSMDCVNDFGLMELLKQSNAAGKFFVITARNHLAKARLNLEMNAEMNDSINIGNCYNSCLFILCLGPFDLLCVLFLFVLSLYRPLLSLFLSFLD